MCTVSFLPTASGFILAMNRDEQKSRVTALPPARKMNSAHVGLYPAEPDGGTWIGVNDAGLCFALINWNEKPQGPTDIGRGTIIPQLLSCDSLDGAGKRLAGLQLSRINAFRLMGMGGEQLRQWRWDGAALEMMEQDWKAQHWFSSALDETGVNRVRAETVAASKATKTIEDLRGLHRAHIPARDAYAICMHRPDAQTVSYTEVVVDSGRATMAYAPGAPCEQALGGAVELELV